MPPMPWQSRSVTYTRRDGANWEGLTGGGAGDGGGCGEGEGEAKTTGHV